MKHYIKHLTTWTYEDSMDWEYLPAFGNLFGQYIGGDVSVCRLVARDVYYKLTVNSYSAIDHGTATFYVMSVDPLYPLVEELRRIAIRRAKRIET